ncbi:MAG: MarR family transcriptional regulator [Actinomycetota bacterium]|jgi:DNA-binding MarR family transcriptional regulator|nr:MarR family transcriptional regulator [Actinomycetota bacterium]MDA3035604.1 MarR family transcriptional regulator [Actinomycetota bacterium]
MARLDAQRVAAWRGMQARVGVIERQLDDALREEWDLPLTWFDTLAALQRLGGRARPIDVAYELALPASSLSRRLDRLEEDGWVVRHRDVDAADHRAVDVELTPRGRNLWRAMNVTYRRAVQAAFAQQLDDDHIATLHEILTLLIPEPDPGPPPDEFENYV